MVTRQYTQGVPPGVTLTDSTFAVFFFFFCLQRKSYQGALKSNNKADKKYREKSSAALDKDRVGFRVPLEVILDCVLWK